jgi:hypothetical protein
MSKVLPESTLLKKGKLEKYLRERHQFENEQMHKRLTWLGSFQALLFAGLSIAWGKDRALILVISLLGLIIAIQGIFALWGVGNSLKKIHEKWVDKGLSEISGLGVFGLYEGENVSAARVFPWPEFSIPIAFSLAWAAVLCISLFR